MVDHPQPIPTDSEWLTLAEAALWAKLHPATLRREVKAGRLRAARVGGRSALRIRRSWVDEWLLASSTPIEVAR